jgi:hypothetical protein
MSYCFPTLVMNRGAQAACLTVRFSALAAPAKQSLEEQVLGPHDAVDGLVRRVANGADRVRLWHRLRPTLVAGALILHVHCDLSEG